MKRTVGPGPQAATLSACGAPATAAHNTGGVWGLDPGHNRGLIDRLRPHARRFTLKTVQVGEGWRPLIEECHERLEAAFPDYELLAVKQKYGALEFQAAPRHRPLGQKALTAQENTDLHKITSDIGKRSLPSPRTYPVTPQPGLARLMEWPLGMVGMLLGSAQALSLANGHCLVLHRR